MIYEELYDLSSRARSSVNRAVDLAFDGRLGQMRSSQYRLPDPELAALKSELDLAISLLLDIKTRVDA